MTIAVTWQNNPSVAQGLTFNAPLMTSLVPVSAGGLYTPTFTRATTAYVSGYNPAAVAGADQRLILCDSGEARFSGARRVSAGVYSDVFSDGTPIPSATLMGYLAEEARTNIILQSQTFNTTWAVSNAADMNAPEADIYTAPDATTTAYRLKPKATTAVHSLDQTVTFTAAVHTTSMYLRYVTATPQRWVALVMNDGTTTWAASFDLLNGVAGAVSNATSTIEYAGLANVWRVTVTKSAAAAAAGGTVKISLNATDTATLESAARAGTETLGVWGAQLEAGTFASSYIPTTTVAVTRNADVLTYPFAGNGNRLTGTWYAEVLQESSDIASNPAIATWVYSDGVGNAGMMLRRSVGKGTLFSGGSGVITDVPTANTIAAGVLTKLAGSFSGTAALVSANGGAAASGTFTPAAADPVTLYIGSNSSTTSQIDGTVRNVRIYGTQFTAAQLQALTA